MLLHTTAVEIYEPEDVAGDYNAATTWSDATESAWQVEPEETNPTERNNNDPHSFKRWVAAAPIADVVGERWRVDALGRSFRVTGVANGVGLGLDHLVVNLVEVA